MRKGRPREYGEAGAVRKTLSFDPKLLETFLGEWRKRGTVNASKAMQAAMRLWLSMEGSKTASAAISLPPVASKDAKHVHVTLPEEFGNALERYGKRTVRSVPDLAREGLALVIRRDPNAPEFKGLEEWRFMRDDPKASELGEETAPPSEQSKT